MIFLCVGKLKESYLKEAQKEYQKRLSRFTAIEVIEIEEEKAPMNPSPLQIKQILQKEGERIEKALPPKAVAVALCLEGQMLSSPAAAQKLMKWQQEGTVCFVVGGSYGLSEKIKQESHFLWKFSDLTFPHQLFRILLLEQVYRSFKINGGETYHK